MEMENGKSSNRKNEIAYQTILNILYKNFYMILPLNEMHNILLND